VWGVYRLKTQRIRLWSYFSISLDIERSGCTIERLIYYQTNGFRVLSERSAMLSNVR
jgi:hypothetical protein